MSMTGVAWQRTDGTGRTGAAFGYCASSLVLGLMAWSTVPLVLVPPAWPVLRRWANALASAERRRGTTLGQPPIPDPVHQNARAALGYAVLLGVVGPAGGVLLLTTLAGGLILVSVPVVVAVVAPDTVMIPAGHHVASPWAGLPHLAVGVLLFAVAGLAAHGVAFGQAWLARLLLTPRSASRVELVQSRSRLVSAFEAERRRIERDLHDGVQTHLLALSMTLGLAALESADQPATRALVDRARAQVDEVHDRLRELVRGIHPQVLRDHGLAAAIAAGADDMPVALTVDVRLPRLDGVLESDLYFFVLEAATNAVRHGGATEITVRGRLGQPDSAASRRLSLEVTDNGRGGADPAAGTGLSGMADRLAVHNGELTVVSPCGGPTRVTATVVVRG